MKKLIIAAMAASIVMTFASCGDSKEDTNEDKKAATQATTAAAAGAESEAEKEVEEGAGSAEAEVESEAEEETTTTTTTAKETEAPAETEESKAEETTEESKADAAGDESKADAAGDESKEEDGAKTGEKNFTVEVSGNWEMTEDSFGNTTITYKGTDIENAKDTCTILINSDEVEGLSEMTMEQIGTTFTNSMGLGDALKIDKQEESTFNGYEAYVCEGIYTSMGLDFNIKIIVCRKDNIMLMVVPMAYNEVADAIQPEMQTIMDTIKIK